MVTFAAEISMAKQERNPATATVKLDPELLRKAKQVLLVDGGKLTAYVDKLVRSAIERDYSRVMKSIRSQGAKEQE